MRQLGKKYLLLIVIISVGICNNEAIAQASGDSELSTQEIIKDNDINSLLNRASQIQGRDPEAALNYYQKAVDLAEESGEEESIIKTEGSLAAYYERLNDYSNAIEHYEKALTIVQKSNDKALTAKISISLGNIYTSISDYSQALDYNLKALKINKELNDLQGIVESLHNISIVYYYYLNFTKAREYNFKAVEIYRQLKDTAGISKSYSNIAMIYTNLDSIDQAIEYNQRALRLMQKTKNRLGTANIYTNLGIALKKKREYDSSLTYLFKALEIFDPRTSLRNRILVLANIGITYNKMNDYNKALKYADEGYNLAKTSQSPDLSAIIFNLYSDIYTNLEDYKNAYKYEKAFLAIRDSIFNEENRNKISELEVKIETEQKTKEYELLRKADRLQLIMVILAGSLMLIIAIVLYSRYRTKQKANMQLEEKNKLITEQKENLQNLNVELNEANAAKDKFFSIMAHDLKSPLWWLKNVTDRLSTKYEELSKEKIIEITKILDDSAQTSLHLIENLLQWSRSQSGRIEFQPETINLQSMYKNIMSQHGVHATEKNIKVETNIDENSIVTADKNMLYSILRNLLSNAIKFTPKDGSISITYLQTEGEYKITVKDSGVGIEPDKIDKIFRIDVQTTSLGTNQEKGTGLGLILTNEFVRKHGGDLSIESGPGKGSTFTFSIPKKQ